MKNVALTILRLAKSIMAETSLDGMSKDTAKRHVNQLLAHYTKGLFSDESWKPINDIWKALTSAQIDWTLMDNKYLHNESGRPSGKTWSFNIKFITNKGRPAVLYGVVTASGAGSVEDPLEKYDLVAYMS
jgi:hypothetical protein